MNTAKISKKRLNELKEMSDLSDAKIDFSDIPELNNTFWQNAKIEFPKVKKLVSIRLDRDVISWYKEQFKEYQTAMNAVLKSYMTSLKK
jgi:uncharacterized protein (DUF4415 family)